MNGVRHSNWPSQYFSPEEVLSESGLSILHSKGICLFHHSFLHKLNMFRSILDKPITVNTKSSPHRGYRDSEENKLAGGAPHSMHQFGQAADVSVPGMSPSQIAEIARNTGLFSGIAYSESRGFCHIDDRFNVDGGITTWTYS